MGVACLSACLLSRKRELTVLSPGFTSTIRDRHDLGRPSKRFREKLMGTE